MTNSFKENINTVREIYPGTYQIILDFASNKFIEHIIRNSHKMIWIHEFFRKTNSSWSSFQLPISDKYQDTFLARHISFEFIIQTNEYQHLKNELSNGITLLQINRLPPYFLDLREIKGKTRYDLLKKECDYLFEIVIPAATDYGTLISSNKEYLTSLLQDKSINWQDLP